MTGGIESTGNMKPDSIIEGSEMNIATIWACIRVCAIVETSSPWPTDVSMKSSIASDRKNRSARRTGTRNHSDAHDEDDRRPPPPRRACRAASCRSGTADLDTGVTKICSSVPRSRSLTTDWATSVVTDMSRMKASRPGTIVFTERIVGLNQTRIWASTPGPCAAAAMPAAAAPPSPADQPCAQVPQDVGRVGARDLAGVGLGPVHDHLDRRLLALRPGPARTPGG